MRLKSIGARIWIDDFGTGYSSLSYLHKLPVDTVKIDQPFVNCIGENGANGILVRTIINMAQCLGLGVIAEGIEKPHQLVFLRLNDCNDAQGFLIGRPSSAAEIEKRLEIPSGTAAIARLKISQ